MVAAMLAAMWLVWLLDVLTGCNGVESPPEAEPEEYYCGWRYALSTGPAWSVRGALVGIPLMWLCHSDLWHLLGNSLGFALYGVLIVLRSGGPRRFLQATSCAQLSAGLGTWLTRPACGASGIVFGHFGYTLSLGMLRMCGLPPLPERCASPGECPARFCDCVGRWCASERWACTMSTVADLGVSLAVFLLFDSTIFGVLPGASAQYVSWVCAVASNAGPLASAAA